MNDKVSNSRKQAKESILHLSFVIAGNGAQSAWGISGQ
jgi:hypothetical protein